MDRMGTADDPAAAVNARGKLLPVPPVADREAVVKRIAELDAATFRTRKAAEAALAAGGEAVARCSGKPCRGRSRWSNGSESNCCWNGCGTSRRRTNGG